MDSKTLQSLRIGDTVTIHLTHPGSDGPRKQPFDVVIARINHTGKAYKDDVDGRYYEARQVSWLWRNMPLELQPNELVRDDIRGYDTVSEGWIAAIVARGPYQAQPQPRNILYAREQSSFLDHKKVEAYRIANGTHSNPFDQRPKTTATGFIYSEWNETYGRDIRPGQYNGHLFDFARVLIARRPALAVRRDLDPDRFYAAWNQAGRPGYTGPFQETEFSPFLRNKEGERIDPSPFKAVVNRKTFTRWVVRNVNRFIVTEAVILANMIQAAKDEERWMREDMEAEFRREYGQELGGIASDNDEIDQQIATQADEDDNYDHQEIRHDHDDYID